MSKTDCQNRSFNTVNHSAWVKMDRQAKEEFVAGNVKLHEECPNIPLPKAAKLKP